ncbi:hypothetical protein ACLB2K_064875 [Fragaria x ananassa]
MGSCFSDMEEGKQVIYGDGYTYDEDGFGLAFPTRYEDTQLLPSAPALSILPGEEEREADAQKEEEERQIAIAIMVSLEPELQQGSIPQLSFWQIEPAADASSSSTPSRQGQARVSQSLSSAQLAQPNGSSSKQECEYCYDAPIGATCDLCGHVACFNCWVKIQDSDNKCPRCRVVIKKIIKLYL